MFLKIKSLKFSYQPISTYLKSYSKNETKYLVCVEWVGTIFSSRISREVWWEPLVKFRVCKVDGWETSVLFVFVGWVGTLFSSLVSRVVWWEPPVRFRVCKEDGLEHSVK